ncbi:MAG: sugar phosphate nucleotidyltransferase [Candidatus Dormibacteria bacterium]
MLPCLVLAGGVGSRMRPITVDLPKALITVCGRPFIDLQLQRLAEAGVHDVVLSIGYLGALLRAHVGDGSQLGITVRYIDEGDRPLGTGGAVRLAVDDGAVNDAFFVLYGDSYLEVDFEAVEQAWRASRCPALMTVVRNDNRWGPSNVEYRRGLVRRYDKWHADDSMHWADYGLLVFTPATVRQHIAPLTVIDLASSLQTLSLSGNLAGLLVRRRFYEIGSPDGLRDLETHLRSRVGSPQR